MDKQGSWLSDLIRVIINSGVRKKCGARVNEAVRQHGVELAMHMHGRQGRVSAAMKLRSARGEYQQ